MKIALIAAEHSGDQLGESLMLALKQIWPQATFFGIGGPKMIARGLQSLYPFEAFCVMGLIEVIKHLPRLWLLRINLAKEIGREKPDILIGIDAPDFNLGLEYIVRKRYQIITIHYVSPSVWAWREKRVHRVAQSANLLLTILPFEQKYYDHLPLQVRYVGHPLVHSLQNIPAQQVCRQELQLPVNAKILAIFPGSRNSELNQLAEIFIQVAHQLKQQHPELILVTAMVDAKKQLLFKQILQKVAPQLDIRIIQGQSVALMQAADLLLAASGTTTLEAMILAKPMVIAYKMNKLSYWILKKLVKSKFIALPNILAGKALVPEFIQHEATCENLTLALNAALTKDHRETLQEFKKMTEVLHKDTATEAANAIHELIIKG